MQIPGETPQSQSAFFAVLWSWIVYEGHWLWAHKEICSAVAVGGRWAHKKLSSIRPGIVQDVSAAVIDQVNEKLDSHAVDDKRQFEELKSVIHQDQIDRQREINLAIQEHVSAFHRAVAGD